jgi:hypothetical protein
MTVSAGVEHTVFLKCCHEDAGEMLVVSPLEFYLLPICHVSILW